jgi:hypothetical protein
MARTPPTEFVPARWRGYLQDASGNTSAYRHCWELCVLLCLRDALRCGDVYVPGSRRYANPTAYLIIPEAWDIQREEFCRLVERLPVLSVLVNTVNQRRKTTRELLLAESSDSSPGRVRPVPGQTPHQWR